MASDPDPSPAAAAPPDPRLAFDREKWADERALRDRELRLKEADAPSHWRSPVVVAILAATFAALGNAGVSLLNARGQARLERVKAEQTLIIEAIKTGGDTDKAVANLKFLVETGLVTDPERQKAIAAYLRKNKETPELLPSLPTQGAAGDPKTSVSERAAHLDPAAACRPAAPSGYCVSQGVLVNGAGKPVQVIDATGRGAKLKPPVAIVMHFSASADGVAAKLFSSDTLRASTHLEIERDGRLVQFVPFDVAAWHAGASAWNGYTGLNSNTIGVQFSNWGQLKGGPGHWTAYAGAAVPDDRVLVVRNAATGVETGWEKYTDAQLAAAEAAVRALAAAYPTITAVVGHDDITGGRKTDPGPAFPKARFAALLPAKP